MIEIYDEMSHIKDVLAHGFKSNTWRTDGKLLAMYYRDSGIKKSEALKKIKSKCEKYCASDGAYNKTESYKVVNSFVNKVYKKEKDGTYKEQIREITHVVITKDILKWFLALEEGFVLDDETLELEKQRRPRLTIKNNVMNFNRVKYLFTLYIWTLINEQFLERPDIIYLNNNEDKKRFKERADLPSNFNLSRERNLMFDLKLIDVNHGLGITPLFKTNVPFFCYDKEIIDRNNLIVIDGEDLYNCGYWLQKQKFGSFVCQNCGKEFAHYSLAKNECKRKYCKECAEIIKNNLSEKKRFCIDCGKEIDANSRKINSRTIRCANCQVKHVNELKRRYDSTSRAN